MTEVQRWYSFPRLHVQPWAEQELNLGSLVLEPALVLWLYHSLALSFHKRDISAQKSGGASQNKSNSLNFNLFSSIKNSLFYSLLAEIFVNIITDLHGPTKQALISTIREYLDKYNIKVKLKHFQCRNIWWIISLKREHINHRIFMLRRSSKSTSSILFWV